jgi:hypothetical protein
MVAIGGIADIVQHWHEMARSRMTHFDRCRDRLAATQFGFPTEGPARVQFDMMWSSATLREAGGTSSRLLAQSGHQSAFVLV